MYPLGRDKIIICGKGGSTGLMMDEALARLVAQGHDGDRSKILLVGDRFDTDVAAGNLAIREQKQERRFFLLVWSPHVVFGSSLFLSFSLSHSDRAKNNRVCCVTLEKNTKRLS